MEADSISERDQEDLDAQTAKGSEDQVDIDSEDDGFHEEFNDKQIQHIKSLCRVVTKQKINENMERLQKDQLDSVAEKLEDITRDVDLFRDHFEGLEALLEFSRDDQSRAGSSILENLAQYVCNSDDFGGKVQACLDRFESSNITDRFVTNQKLIKKILPGLCSR